MLNDGAYAYAKACGIIGKSYVGKRISSLTGLHTLTELDRTIFPGFHQELPGKELLIDLEHRIIKRAVDQILSIVNSYINPPEFLVQMLRVYEYSDLKVCLQLICAGKKDPPLLSDLGRFQTVHFGKFPDIAAMLRNTEFDSLLSGDIRNLHPDTDFAPIETKLDSLYYFGLAESLSRLSSEDRQEAQRLLAIEISLRNCVWALRLRTYYQKTAADTKKYLMDIKLHGGAGRKSSLAAEAVESLKLPLDTRNSWRYWKWARFLNPEVPSVNWVANPRYFQNAASQYMYQLARRSFHRSPMSVSAIFCFIKIKQFEEDILTSVAEGLALGMESSGVFNLLEAPS